MSDPQLFLLSFLGLLLSVGYYIQVNMKREQTEEFYKLHLFQEDLTSGETGGQQAPPPLAVVVLSRLHHTEQRRAIRETWAKSAAKHGAKLVSCFLLFSINFS